MSPTGHLPEPCASCGGVMKPVRSVPRVGPHPELVTFRCEQCGDLLTKPVEDEPQD